jgi:hypothetical protein
MLRDEITGFDGKEFSYLLYCTTIPGTGSGYNPYGNCYGSFVDDRKRNFLMKFLFKIIPDDSKREEEGARKKASTWDANIR